MWLAHQANPNMNEVSNPNMNEVSNSNINEAATLEMPDNLISIGHFTQPFGKDGAMKLRNSGDPSHLQGIKKVWLEHHGWVVVRKLEIYNQVVVLKIAGFTQRHLTDELRGLEVYADKTAIRLPQGTHFYHDLIGLPVVAPDGSSLGVLKSIMDAGTADILVVNYNNKEVLVPLQAPYVQILEGKIEIEPITGLFDAI
jgi:16S rRNA processing protein RimM